MAVGEGEQQQQLALLHDLDPTQLLQDGSQPIQAAAFYAAHKAKQQAVQQPSQPGVCPCDGSAGVCYSTRQTPSLQFAVLL